jgi:REP element-mobilizing transposase RayT
MSYTSLHYHLVFSTKERRPHLGGELAKRVYPFLGGIARDLKCTLLIGGGAADHVHLLADVHQSLALADFVKEMKVASSRWIHETFSDEQHFGWQDGYSAFTVSKSIVPAVDKYIRSQEAHHHKQTFQEELLALLKRHGIEYDERYIWR